MLVCAVDGRIVSTNPATADLLGGGKALLPGRRITDLWQGGAASDIGALIEHLFRTGRPAIVEAPVPGLANPPDALRLNLHPVRSRAQPHEVRYVVVTVSRAA